MELKFIKNMTQKKKLTLIAISVIALTLIFLFISAQEDKTSFTENPIQNEDLGSTSDDGLSYPGSVSDGFSRVSIEGAVVVAGDKKFTTDKNGVWPVAGIEPGMNISVFANGYSPYQGSFNPDEVISLLPMPSRKISARVYNETGSPEHDVFLILLDSNSMQPKEILRPDENSTAIFSDVPSGDTIIFAIKKGYRLGWKISHEKLIDAEVSIVLKKRVPLGNISKGNSQPTAQKRSWTPLAQTVYAQDAGYEFEQAFPEEYRLMMERNERSSAAKAVELSPDDVADELERDPSARDWNSLGANKLEFSDEIPDGYSLERRMVDGKEVFVVETEIYTDSVRQEMTGLAIDYGEMSLEAQAQRKVQAALGGRTRFEISILSLIDESFSEGYAKGLNDTTRYPVNNSLAPSRFFYSDDGGSTMPPVLYDKTGKIVVTEDVRNEFIEVSEKIFEDNPKFSISMNGSDERVAIVGEPFTLETKVILNHNPVPGWHILKPAAIGGIFKSRWIFNPDSRFRELGKIMPYMVANAPARDTQFSGEYTQEQKFTCLDPGEETVTYEFQVAYRFNKDAADPRGTIMPGESDYTYFAPIIIKCEAPTLLSHNAPDQCGNPANAVIRGRIGGDHQEILQGVEIYMTKDGAGYAGTVFAPIQGGVFEATVPLPPGFYYYWVFGKTENGHVYRMSEIEGTFEVREKKEDGTKCDGEEEPTEEDCSDPSSSCYENKAPEKKYKSCEETGTCDQGTGWVVPR